MKKAKRLLAVIMAAVMILSAACLPVYAHIDSSDNYFVPKTGADGKYYYTYEQGAAWVLDLLDGLLAESNIIMTADDLNDLANIGINIFTSNILLNLDKYLEDAGLWYGDDGALMLTSVNNLIQSLSAFMHCLDDNWLAVAASAVGLLGDLTDGDVLGTASLRNVGCINAKILRYNGVSTDRAVLEMLINFLYEKKALFVKLIGGTLDLGSLLGGLLGDKLADLLPGVTIESKKVKNVDVGIKNLLYTKLIDDSAAAMPDGMTLDQAVQQVVNWALITGTDDTAAGGANSLLGANMDPLMPAIADKPGAAGIVYSTDTFQADRNSDGVMENVTMNTYQFVANLLDALMGGMLGPMLAELLYDLVGIEITEEFPYGDPALMSDQMFSLIVGLVESLLVQNGAPKPSFTEEENTYPALKIDALIDWLFNGGGLDTFILIDYKGIQIQDNFMSLLNDIVRLLVNMLPSLGLFESSAHLGYEPSELTAIWYYDEAGNLVAEDAEGVVDQTYITYENGDILYATEYQDIDGVTTATAYNYLSNGMPVNISDKNASDYVNPSFVRPNYVVATKSVYATIIKMALNDMIEGCYFPEWATDIPTVLAYGLAALAAPATPQNNYYARLDAYHELIENGGLGVVVDENNEALDPIPYSVQKAVPIYDIDGLLIETRYVTVPKGAIDIGCSYLAAYLNTVFQFDQDAHKLSTDTSFEQFLSELAIWGFTKYLPLLAGEDKNNDGKMDQYILNSLGVSLGGSATWYNEVNTFIDAVYEDFSAREYKETANFDAIYDLIDATLFSLLPASWLPDIGGSNQFINDWLLGNLIEFDLQGILALLTVNSDPDAELAKYPLIPVIIRVLDRILAAVFGDNGLLLPTGRTGVVENQNLTSIKTLDALLSTAGGDSDSLPYLIDSLFTNIYKFHVPLFATLLPLIAGAEYERPYDTSVLGSIGNTYNIAYLEDYIDEFEDNINATYVTTVEDEEFANLWVKAEGTIVRTADGTAYEVKMGEGVYGPYGTRAEAKAALEQVKGCYVFARETGETVDELTGEVTYTYAYDIYRPWSYLDTATENPNAIDEANGETYSTYSDFHFANLNKRSPKVSYEEGDYRFFTYEDFGVAGFAYRNAKDSVDEAKEFVSAYKGFAESDLSAAYGEWLMYTVEGRLRAADLWDPNNDGRSVTSDTDGDYVAETVDSNGNVTDPGFPVDGDPGVPTSMFPLYSTSTSAAEYKDQMTGENISVQRNSINPTNYEQLALALEHAQFEGNDVTLDLEDTESVVRLAIGSIAFDITPNDDGSYNAGSVQWDGVNLAAVGSWCIYNGFKLQQDEEGNYVIKRAAFSLFTESTNFGMSGVSPVPMTKADFDAYKNQKMSEADARTYADDAKIQIYKSYIDYVETIYANRRSLYNKIDYIGFRYEKAEELRKTSTDTTMLEWAIRHTAGAYKDPDSGMRNQYYTGDWDEVENKAVTDKVYTTASYEAFRKAVDYGNSLVTASANSVLANELTQTMVSEAYLGILKTYFELIPYTGDADWTQLNSYIVTATAILADPNKNDPVLGYASGLDILEYTLNDSNELKADPEIDSERQGEVDQMAAALRQAILNLVYNTAPSIVTNVGSLGENVVGTVKTSNVNNRIVGQVFGLKEGVGAVMDAIQLVGMMEDSATGNAISIEASGRGVGTGAYYKGTVGGNERFRYYAVVYGDINGDSRIDGTDASALEIYKALDTVNSNVMGTARFEAADANHDGNVDQLDIDAIRNHYTFAMDENGVRLAIGQDEHSSGATVEEGDTDLTAA